MKRYWVSKYERICRNCGVEEAVRKFKNLRVTILEYLADEHRKSNLDKFLGSTGFRNNGMLRQLFEYADCQPHALLDFLKLYTGPVKSTQSADQAAYATKRRLASVRANPAVPSYLTAWLRTLSERHGKSYDRAIRDPKDPFHALALNLGSYDSWHAYWGKWYSLLKRGWKSSSQLDYKLVWPEIYKDYVNLQEGSNTFRQDFADLVSMHLSDETCLSQEELEFVDEFLNEDVGDALMAVLWGDEPSNQELSGIFSETSMLSGLYVGYVHHIHKKGGGTDLRDIAVPNRFIQGALVPAADRMYNLVRSLPQDATFDQDRFDRKLQNRVNNPNLYAGSVDLSKATDNLPFNWGREIVSVLQRLYGISPEVLMLRSIYEISLSEREREKEKREIAFKRSFALFETVARAKWLDEGFLTEWQVGQPLGSLPSFAMLAITHNLFTESLCASLGYAHSPYVILGDDIVILNRRIRKRYIRELISRGIPLSLHKSFEGRLSEFAGKTYVRNCVPFYCSDHNPVTWNSLFDWQRTTGIRIPWMYLPRSIKSKIYKIVRRAIATGDSHECGKDKPSKNSVTKLAVSAYELVQTCEVYGRGSHIYPVRDSEEMSERMSRYFEYRITDNQLPDAVKHTGITLLGNGHPIRLMSDRFADKDGWFQRFRPVELPEWYKAKVRPCTTDAALDAALQSLLETSSKETDA
jgi:hypothetical protein